MEKRFLFYRIGICGWVPLPMGWIGGMPRLPARFDTGGTDARRRSPAMVPRLCQLLACVAPLRFSTMTLGLGEPMANSR
jgi:hypothetical protein